MKKQSNLSRLLAVAGGHKYLLYASWVLSAISALIALVPFYYIWKIIREVQEIRIMLTHQSLEQFFFTFIVAVKGSGCHTYGFYDIP